MPEIRYGAAEDSFLTGLRNFLYVSIREELTASDIKRNCMKGRERLESAALCRNNSKGHISVIKSRGGVRIRRGERACAVELCRTVFEDNPGQMVYNVHKHNTNRHRTWEHCGRSNETGGFSMLERLAADTSIITYLMAAMGIMGILAKIINHFTLVRLVNAAGNMPKSTHRLIKLVRAKYEHACMIHDSVENIDAFVEKYIYEYRGFLFRIHTWRQIEILTVWFSGILAALGASLHYFFYGPTEPVYQYIAGGIAEMVLLSVLIRLSDEPYKINAVKMYMVDYLENICAFRLRKQLQRDRESIDVISAEGNSKGVFQPVADTRAEMQGDAGSPERTQEIAGAAPKKRGDNRQSVYAAQDAGEDTPHIAQNAEAAQRNDVDQTYRQDQETVRGQQVISAAEESGAAGKAADRRRAEQRIRPEPGLAINIEGEPRDARKGDAARQAVRQSAVRNETDPDRPALREEAIRQILEEFLA